MEKSLPPEEYLEVADKVRTGEYFRESAEMYDLMVHDPMSERYQYVVLTVLAVCVLLIVMVATGAFYPLNREVPFMVASNDLVEDVPRIKSLLAHKGEDPSRALLRFLVRNYVTAYESYDIDTFDRNIGGVKSQSAPEVFDDYQRLIDRNNPDSPLVLYERHSRRQITIISSEETDDDAMEVVFEAMVQSAAEIKKTRWQADITFQYSGLALDDEGEKVKPFTFTVTQYRTKRLQDIR